MKKIILIILSLLIVGGGLGSLCWSKLHETTPTQAIQASHRATKNKRSKASRKIVVTIGKSKLSGHLYHNQAANAVWKKLPMKLRFRNPGPGFVEKIAKTQSIPTNQMATGGNPKPGEIAYWSPQPRIVFYWGQVGYWDGIHRIGRFDTRRATRVIHQRQHFSATIRKAH